MAAVVALVRFYYAAFYGAHALVFLESVAHGWDSEHLSRVEAPSQATDGRPTPFRTDPGTYRCSIHGAAGELIWTRALECPHEALWGAFNDGSSGRVPEPRPPAPFLSPLPNGICKVGGFPTHGRSETIRQLAESNKE